MHFKNLYIETQKQFLFKKIYLQVYYARFYCVHVRVCVCVCVHVILLLIVLIIFFFSFLHFQFDIFSLVKNLRLQRPEMVETKVKRTPNKKHIYMRNFLKFYLQRLITNPIQ